MPKVKLNTIARDKAIARQLLRRSNAATPHRNGRAKEDAKLRKHPNRRYI